MSGTKPLQTLISQIYMENNDQVDWVAVRRAYCAGILAVTSICLQYGVSATALYSRRRAENWPHRYNMSATATKTSKQIHKNKIARLYELLDRLMKEVEMEPVSVANDKGVITTGTADRERSARTLSSLIRSFEKIKELETEELSKIKQTDVDEINEADKKEAEQLSNILQERFARLAQAGDA